MKFREWQENWNQLGKDDPLWAILTLPHKKGGRWQRDEFFATGIDEINQALERLGTLGVKPRFDKALDFGCGVGRLSQALSTHFTEVHGVDISPSMIAQAKEFGRGSPRCHFHVNSSDRLELFANDTFDFVYSNLVLQHIEPKYAKSYIQEFVRVLNPGGVVVFQTLSATILRRLFPQSLVDVYRKIKHRSKPIIASFGIPERDIVDLVSRAGGEVVDVEGSPMGWRWRWRSQFFVVRKQLR